MKIYIDMTEARDTRNTVVAAMPVAIVELSPREGYDMAKVAAFEDDLNRFLQERVPQLFPERNHAD